MMNNKCHENFHDECAMVGGFRAIHGIKDAVTLLHSSSGCKINILYSDMFYKCYEPVPRIFSTTMNAKDVVFGAEQKLERYIEWVSEINPDTSLIALLGCCTSALIGDNVEDVASRMLDRVPQRVIAVETAGFTGKSVKGYNSVLCKLVEEFAEDGEERPEGLVNIIGASSSLPRMRDNVAELKRLLEICGCKVNCVMDYETTMEEIRHAARASLNVVISDQVAPVANLFQDKFGIPHVTVVPYGLENTFELLSQVAGHANSAGLSIIEEEIEKAVQLLKYPARHVAGRGVLVVADTLWASGAISLLRELGCRVYACAYDDVPLNNDKFSADPSVTFVSYADVDDMAHSRTFDFVIGSSLEVEWTRKLNIPLIRMFYPLFDRIDLTPRPDMGIRGAVNLGEEIMNTLLPEYYYGTY